jgi:hypothetical protein
VSNVIITKGGGSNMINANGEFLYTCAEIGYALGINPNTIRAGAKKLFASYTKFQFTVVEAQRIKAYFRSISPEQEELRIKLLFDALGVTDKDVEAIAKKTYEEQF